MPDARGRFKKGEHWRAPKPFWEKEWLLDAYVTQGQSAADIARGQRCGEANILYWLQKHGIPRRTVSEARQRKRWSVAGEQNGMYGRTGPESPNWKGGVTPERQAFYASREWGAALRFVWKRDSHLCQRCHKKPKRRGSFHIHHRISFRVTALRANYDNLTLLCRACHHWVHSRKNLRKEFLGAFQASLLE